MNYWLMKTEPDVFSWSKLESDGSAIWDGVRNYAARNHMRAMKKGDQVLIYHSNIGKEVVGIATVSKEHFQDPTTDDDKWSAVEVQPKQALKKSVTLELIKKTPELSQIKLITIGRLSVMPVTKVEFDTIIKLSK